MRGLLCPGFVRRLILPAFISLNALAVVCDVAGRGCCLQGPVLPPTRTPFTGNVLVRFHGLLLGLPPGASRDWEPQKA